MEFNFMLDIEIKLTEEGCKRVIELFKSNDNFINSFKIGLKELILDEMKSDMDAGLLEVNLEVIDY